MVNGTVRAIAEDPSGEVIYLGGDFTRAGGDFRPYKVALNIEDGTIANDFPLSDGTIYALAPDESGGYYIGGTFSQVGDSARTNIAQINSAGQVTSFNPSVGSVRSLTVADGRLYVGGLSFISAIETNTNRQISWQVSVGGSSRGQVNSIAVADNTLYAGGNFSRVGDSTRTHLVAINTSDGSVTSRNFNFSFFDRVNSLAVAKGTLYVGGDFVRIGNESRVGLAAFNTNDGSLTNWNPPLSNGGTSVRINSLVVVGDTLITGGDFSVVSGEFRNDLAAFNTNNGSLISWNPNPGGRFGNALSVQSLAVADNIVYVGSRTVESIAAFDVKSGRPATLSLPDLNGAVFGLAIFENKLYIRGDFTRVNRQKRNHLAAININNRTVTDWNPNVNGVVKSLKIVGDTVYVGGNFSRVGDSTRNDIAAVDISDGSVTSWNPNVVSSSGRDEGVKSLAVVDNTLYVGGSFSSVGGLARNDIAAIKISDGSVTSWNPGKGNSFGSGSRISVNSIAISGSTVYVGGDFSRMGVNESPRVNLAAVNMSDGTVTSFRSLLDASSFYSVRSLALAGDTLYVGGFFNSIGNKPRNGLAAINTSDGSVTSWNPTQKPSDVHVFAVEGETVYFGGEGNVIRGSSTFSTENPELRIPIASFNTNNDSPTNWNPDGSRGYGVVHSLAVVGGKVYAGGDFYYFSSGQSAGHLVEIGTVQITSEDNKPFAENSTDTIHTVRAADADGDNLTYTITAGLDSSKFRIDKNTGALAFKAAPDFENPSDQDIDNIYEVVVTASDGTNSDTQIITITVTDVNEVPIIAAQTFSVGENAAAGTVVGSVAATDSEGDDLTFSITSGNAIGNTSDVFQINNMGEVTVKTPAPLDFEKMPAFMLAVSASDGKLSATADITVTVTDVNEVPKITSLAMATIAENTTDALTVTATDADADAVIMYAISGGADGALFNIDANSGALTFITAPDFEGSSADGDDDYEVIVTASDGENSVTQTITITVTDVNDNDPAITSAATASIVEGTIEVLTVTATDADAGTTLTYSISGSADGALFSIDASSGVLTFITAPDFEDSSADGDDEYEVIVTASDGENSVMQTIIVTVTRDVLGLPEAEGVRLYPNPASGHFTLAGTLGRLSRISLVSTAGKEVRSYPASKDGVYDTSGLSEGIFFVIIEGTEGRKQAGRIVIRK